MRQPADRDLHVRLAPFLERGLIRGVPSAWQLACGSIEMAPYVIMPDAGDDARYAGAPLGHPLARTPLVMSQVGWEHLRIGHGLFTSPAAQRLHLNFVFHEGMPVYDLQLTQTHPDGLERLRASMQALDAPTTPLERRHSRLVDLVIPDAAAYRAAFTAPGGYIDRAAAFDYPAPADAADFLRPEFTHLTTFIDYCLDAFPRTAPPGAVWRNARTVVDLATRRLRKVGMMRASATALAG